MDIAQSQAETVLLKAKDIETAGCSGVEAAWLYNWASRMSSIVEIGAWKGKSTYILSQACKGRVFTVDHFRGSSTINDATYLALIPENKRNIYEQFRKNIGYPENLVVLRTDSVEASKFFANFSIDMIYIDGDHEYEYFKADLVAWYPKFKKLICGHDRDITGVKRVLEEFKIPYRNGAGEMWYWEKK